jgi:hypothetical protein
MKSFWSHKTLSICAALICSAALLSYLTFKMTKERSLVEHMKTVRVQAERGDTGAEMELGHLYYRGLGVAVDYSQAASWFRKAADKGDAKAQYSLGYLYWFGQGVPKDLAEAVQWYRKAADQGDARAESALGSSYYYGQGVEQDRAIAAGWYRKASDRGIADAQYDLGYMLYYGQGVAQDRAEADRLFRQAADQGNENARRTLGARRRALSPLEKTFLFVNFSGGLLLLTGSLPHRHQARNRGRQVPALAGSLILAYGGLDLFRHFNNTIVPFSSADTALVFTRDLLGGVCLAMLLVIVLTRERARTILVISCVLLVVFNLSVFAAYVLLHRAPIARIFISGFMWFIGTATTSAILLWLKRRRSGDKLNGASDLTPTKITAG